MKWNRVLISHSYMIRNLHWCAWDILYNIIILRLFCWCFIEVLLKLPSVRVTIHLKTLYIKSGGPGTFNGSGG